MTGGPDLDDFRSFYLPPLPPLYFLLYFLPFKNVKMDHNHIRMSEKLKELPKTTWGFLSLYIPSSFNPLLLPNNVCIPLEVLVALRGLLIVQYENLWKLALF